MCIKKLPLLFSILIFSFNAYSSEKQLDENLQYFRELYTQANAQYEYEKELGLDIDIVVSEIKQKYSEQCDIEEDINSDILVTCYGEVLEKYQKVPNNHFAIHTDNKGYGYKYWLWNYSDILFTKKGEDFYCFSPYGTKIKRGGKYTGNEENMFKFIYKGMELYCFGIFADEWIYETAISVDNKDYPIHLFQLPSFSHNESGIGMRTTNKTFYICFNDFKFDWDDAKKSRELHKNLNEYIKVFHEGDYENVIVDLRGNHGGMERSFYPFLQGLACGKYAENSRLYKKKIDSIMNGSKRYYSDYINQNFIGVMKDNPGSYDELEMKKLKNSKGFYCEQNKDAYYDFDCKYKGKLIILMNYWSASAAELFIMESYIFDDVTLVGCNTSGCMDFGGSLNYELPHSNISITLTDTSYKETGFLQDNPHWHGDGKGFYPDYWAGDDFLLPILVELTSDKKLRKVLKNINDGFCY